LTQKLTEPQKRELKHKLLAFGEFEVAPGCENECHWLSPLFGHKVVTTKEALRLSVERLIGEG
jgi:hypothetical protein